MQNVRIALQGLNLAAYEMNEICARFDTKVLTKNKVLLSPGKVADTLFFIESGSLVLGVEIDNKQYVRHVAVAGEFLCSLNSFLSQTPANEFIRSVGNTSVCVLSKKDFDILCKQYPVLEQFYHKAIQEKLVKCQARITDLISLDAVEQYNKLVGEKSKILQVVPQYELASYMGIKPESLSRLRKRKPK